MFVDFKYAFFDAILLELTERSLTVCAGKFAKTYLSEQFFFVRRGLYKAGESGPGSTELLWGPLLPVFGEEGFGHFKMA